MRDERKVTALAMQGVKGWGPRTVSRLWRAFGSIDQILNAPVSAIAAVTGESELVAAARIRSSDVRLVRRKRALPAYKSFSRRFLM